MFQVLAVERMSQILVKSIFFVVHFSGEFFFWERHCSGELFEGRELVYLLSDYSDGRLQPLIGLLVFLKIA